jgi:NADPH:quinone reductase
MTAEEIRAVVVTAHGGPETLAVQSRPRPQPGSGEVLVEVTASGVNFIDVYQREGVYPTTPPFTLGIECAGRVTSLGPDVTDLAVGDLVATADAYHGSHATAVVVAADRLVPVPAGVSGELAAATMLQGMTAHYLTVSTHPVSAGEEVLVHAAAGGVGQLLVQVARSAGAHVVATVGSAAKADVARDLGAHEVLRYDQFDDPAELADAVRAASGGGVHVAYDGVGQATFDASLAALRPRGLLVLFGAASGQVPPFDLQRLNRGGSLFVTRPTLASYVATTDELRWRAGAMLTAIADGTLQIDIGGRYSLERAADAYRDLEGRRSTGKLLIIP